MSHGRKLAGRRLATITIDQIISGASNVLAAVLAARLLAVASFGLFGIVFLVYVTVVSVNRGLVCDPLLVHPAEAEGRTGVVIGTSWMIGVALGVGLGIVGVGIDLWDQTLGSALVVLAACTPFLVLQDVGRYIGIASQRPRFAVELDTVWLVLMLAAIAVLIVIHVHVLAWYVTAWAGSGAVASFWLLSRYRLSEVQLNLSWLRQTWSFSWRSLVAYLSSQFSALGVSSGIGLIAGARALGGLQGAALMVRPFNTFQTAAFAASLGDISRSLGGTGRLRRAVATTTVLATGAALVNVVVVLALPNGLGRDVLGASWRPAVPLLLPTGIQILGVGACTGVQSGLLAARAVRTVMVLNITGTFLFLVTAIAGAVIDGVVGAVWAVAIGQTGMLIVWWISFWSYSGRMRPATVEPLVSVQATATS